MVDLKNIFENRINIDPQVRSINGLFFTVDTELEKTNYKPSYQRNYVWDDEKASYFIESIFLGTEVPPIVMFKSVDKEGVNNFEVIDGRQRYQTIIRFINGDLKLKKSGLQKLGDLKEFVGNSYVDLDERYKTLFKFTNIRTIVYNFIGSYEPEEEDAVKREIFQRYNSGITPLKTFEIDKAQYFHNDFNQSLKELLCESKIEDKVTRVFRWEKLNIEQKAIKARELLVLPRIPIKYYANKKTRIVEKYFEYISTQFEEEELNNLLCSFHNKINILSCVYDAMEKKGIEYNKFYSECLFWAMCVMDQNGIEYDLEDSELLDKLFYYLEENKSDFTTVRSSFYRVLVGRYESIAKFFEQEYGGSFKLSIDNNDSFRLNNQLLSKEPKSVEAMSFEELRIKKPEPVAIRIPELLDLLQSTKFLLRPSYQRAEVKNRRKASSIIESMLLGITLPPIFVYKKCDETYEVVDGQQRLLSIISFLGKTYKDENGVEQSPQMHDFKLDLGKNSILHSLNGSKYSSLSKVDQNKIRTSSIYMIEIKEVNNKDFDPVDLFVRLNNKPYPISPDSFEMWNSFAERDVIELIKQSVADNSKWFYFRKNNAQMDNEDLFTTLAYFQYCHDQNGNAEGDIVPPKTIESFVIGNRLACRFRMRNEITKLMYSARQNDLSETLNRLQFSFVSNVYDLLDGSSLSIASLNKSMDELLKVKNGKRTQMLFYILWILLHDLSCDVIRMNRSEIRDDINKICGYTESCKCVDDFKNDVTSFREKYHRNHCSMHFPLGAFVKSDLTDDIEPNETSILLQKKPTFEYRFDAKKYSQIDGNTVPSLILLNINRPGVCVNYIEAYLRSRLFFHLYTAAGSKMSADLLAFASVPFISMELQRCFANLMDYVDLAKGSMKPYFERLLDLMFYEQYFAEAFSRLQVKITDEVVKFPILSELDSNEIESTISLVYAEHTKPSNIMSLYLLKAIDMQVLKVTENYLKS